MKTERVAPSSNYQAARLILLTLLGFASFGGISFTAVADNQGFDIVEIERPRIMEKAAQYLKEEPITVTALHCERSAGGKHDFYSEGDYWWPDPKDPEGPYIQRDGMSNPDNFVEHRHAMVRLSDIVGTMTSAYILTGDERYAKQAVKHLKAWFVDEETKMNPNLQYGQPLRGWPPDAARASSTRSI